MDNRMDPVRHCIVIRVAKEQHQIMDDHVVFIQEAHSSLLPLVTRKMIVNHNHAEHARFAVTRDQTDKF